MIPTRWIQTDAEWTARLRVAERPGLHRSAAIVLAHSGDSWFWGVGLGLVWWLGDPVWKQLAGWTFLAVLVLALAVLAVKFLVRRRRPEGEWGAIYRNTDPHSFPSGHAARAFLLATLALGWGPGWLAIALWIWAPLVAVARIAMGLHYLSDVLAGVVLGALAGLIWITVLPVP